jgi:hypothetical protein
MPLGGFGVSLLQSASPGERVSGNFRKFGKSCRESAHDLCNDWYRLVFAFMANLASCLTVKSDNAEDEDNGKSHDHNGVDLQSGRFIGVEPYRRVVSKTYTSSCLCVKGPKLPAQCPLRPATHDWFLPALAASSTCANP